MLERCSHGVVFTGAGISTESGIPDYRSPGGIWDRFRPIDYQEFLTSAEARRAYWRRKFSTQSSVEDARPNEGHIAVAELVRRGTVAWVITQNVDGLHQKSGVPEGRVIELHGNTNYARCLSCRERYELGPIRDAFVVDETLPVCRLCGGHVKSATISFGQPMPREEMRRAEEATTASDVFLAIGSSLGVYPAAGFPVLAKRHGAALVIVNREPTPLDPVADLVLNREIGPTLGTLVGTRRSADDEVAG
ncbi:MAG: NAD-dependent deacetylase [Alphaproteobacteria bacterium]